jgi:hypothetical protein
LESGTSDLPTKHRNLVPEPDDLYCQVGGVTTLQAKQFKQLDEGQIDRRTDRGRTEPSPTVIPQAPESQPPSSRRTDEILGTHRPDETFDTHAVGEPRTAAYPPVAEKCW